MAEVRAAHATDVAAIHDICTKAFHATYQGVLPAGYIGRMLAEFYPPDRIAGRIAPDSPGWLGYQVVEEGGRVLGVAAGGLTAASAAELFMMYLEPSERGRGLGTLLLNRVTEQVRELGATELWVAAVVGNDLGVPFYEARGFTIQSKRRAYGSTDAEDVWSWLLRRSL
ncbi:putative GCN5-related N-acetyltransferase [Actinoplanes missouriensis 431]|uniref:Putative GCN5-related N-acetyltransferase n=1 Tax=Actinoplanes missouriensis (strain ATCC 14538 / DSM 43046 / CBS 188.64 / JCM 3121 / NBRC 102363 / NCIMB 12654 / NRRL B-3342 / UNCC 431) TaxID=512565 RepID=I0GZQ1_ACTM4|nr:GNAT family N-acetyltransferase [Actinoplanes missouriensis]BAL86238.1 putative GCN5-related N-acetyltransferase [Actinoplanes missouriensis 431]